MATSTLRSRTCAQLQKINTCAEAVAKSPSSYLRPNLVALQWYPQLHCQHSCLLSYMDIFLNELLALVKVPTHKCRNVKQTLFRTIDTVFLMFDDKDGDHQKEVLSLNNLDADDLPGQYARSCRGGLSTSST